MAILKSDLPLDLFAPYNVLLMPAHPSNYGYSYNNVESYNLPAGVVWHTPEEDADDVEQTPVYFQMPNVYASTHHYGDNDGDFYQMVPHNRGAYAQGTRRSDDPEVLAGRRVANRHYKGKKDANPPWVPRGTSINVRALSCEVEGRAHSFQWTKPQRQSSVRWGAFVSNLYNFPIDRVHHLGHFEVATDRTDPGPNFHLDDLVEDMYVLGNNKMSQAREFWALVSAVVTPPVLLPNITPLPTENGYDSYKLTMRKK